MRDIGGTFIIVGLSFIAGSFLVRFESQGARRADERRGLPFSPMYDAMGKAALVFRWLGLALLPLGALLMIAAAV